MRQVQRLTAAVLFVLAFASAAYAQDTELISVSRKQTQGVQQFSGTSPITAAMLPVGDESVWISADVLSADRVDPTKSFFISFFTSADNGVTWQRIGGMGWTGHAENETTGPIGLAMPAAGFVNRRIRVEIDVPTRMQLGFTATVTRNLPF
jgi:hypothetical protein